MKPHAPDYVVAQALALATQGYSTRRTMRELQAMYPDEPQLPDHVMISRWVKDYNESQHEEIEGAELRIAQRSIGILEKHLDAVENGEEKINYVTALTGYGIAIDKVQRRRQNSHPTIQNLGPILIVQGKRPDDAIDADFKELPPEEEP